MPNMKLIASKTEPSAAEILLQNMEESSARVLESLRQITVESFDALWNCGCTSEMLTLMGANAVNAFDQHARTVSFLLQSGVEMDPSEYTPPMGYIEHEDGTITL